MSPFSHQSLPSDLLCHEQDITQIVIRPPLPYQAPSQHLPLSPHKPLLAVVTWQESDYGQGCNSS